MLTTWRVLRLTPLLLLSAGCSRGGAGPRTPTAADVAPTGDWSQAPEDVAPTRVELHHLAPPELRQIPEWGAREFGAKRPRTTFRAADQPDPPHRWDEAELDERGSPRRGAELYTSYHGSGCCGGCQTTALLGAVLTQQRIDWRQPQSRRRQPPHRADLPPLEDELDIRMIMGTSRQNVIRGGRDIPTIAPALAIVGAPTRAALGPLIAKGNPWRPQALCRAVAGRDLQVYRARVRAHDVRFMTVALRQGPVVISGAFNRLMRSADGLFRCPGDPPDQRRHHFMVVVGWETNDSDGDGQPDEVVWLARDDWNHQGTDENGLDRDTWSDPWLDDEWMRIVPQGCLLDRGRAHSIIPGSVTLGSFDNPTVPGPDGQRVSYCAADPEGDGVPTAEDTCPFTPDADQADRDGDGIGDRCDPCPDAPPLRRPEFGHWDSDGDWLPDACDPCPAEADLSCTTPPGDGAN